MTKSDYLFIGLKLFGVYAALHGAIALLSLGMMLVLSLRQGNLGHTVWDVGRPMTWFQFLQPVVYLLVAFLLIRRTAWCYRIVCPEDRGEAGRAD